MVEIITDEEFVHFNFAFPTNKVLLALFFSYLHSLHP